MTSICDTHEDVMESLEKEFDKMKRDLGDQAQNFKDLEDEVMKLGNTVHAMLKICFPRLDAMLRNVEGKCIPLPYSSDPRSLQGVTQRSSADSKSISGLNKVATLRNRIASGERLLLAALQGEFEAMQTILDAGADVDFFCKTGKTVLHLAAMKDREDMIALLLERGANIHAKCSNGSTAMHMAASSTEGRCVFQLASAGAAVNARDITGRTPLHVAASLENMDVARRFISAGADKCAKDCKGRTPFELTSAAPFRWILRP